MEVERGGELVRADRVTVPTATDHPGPQFGVVAERLAQGRNEAAIRVTAALASTISRLPTRLLIPAMHAQANSVDFAATTLPGLRGRRRIVDAVIEKSYPLGPRLGCPLNISAFGNDDRLDVGIALTLRRLQNRNLFANVSPWPLHVPADSGPSSFRPGHRKRRTGLRVIQPRTVGDAS